MIIINGLSLPKSHMELVIYSNGDVAVFDRETGAFQEAGAKAVEVGRKKGRLTMMRNLFNHGKAADDYRRRQDLLNHGFELLREPPQTPTKRDKKEKEVRK